ncbi:putative RNA-binding protein C25G10,01 OS=Schizosaccharomyces pombe (strain 972 / ATCC 24843) GN=SPAC25G10.01 PE=1 SV=1 [Rhizoctonia solani AG-1 IB]|uniref:Putative RNA-binding protein C25G10,01 n=2 Tax=Rhizoctonia solani TaxID=456999 RepID=A0A0B7FDN1_THACB|nr:putative RNA-binding protein C25G10,01 OS=Schizosaccharomyces pombe (strain 972 / ATCC 24843) GN=SPAC25G10.01 PE=1 SV=1 [Rhizoctonia solani AG-1 IB]
MTDAWPAPSDTTAPAADGWNGTRADRSPPPHADRERQRDRSRSPGRHGEDRGRSNANGPINLNPGNNIHVSGLSSRVDNKMLDEAFGKFGKVAKASVVYDPHSRESRGFAFVTMESVEEAEAAITGLHNSELAGKPITVEKARRGRARTPTPGKYLGTARRDDRGYSGGYREDRYAAERPYYPREFDSRYSRERFDARDDRRYEERDRYRDDRDRYRDDRYYDRRDRYRYDDGRGGRYEDRR